MAAAFAVFGSSISGLVRWLFGRWVPSWQQLVHNKVLLIGFAAVAAVLHRSALFCIVIMLSSLRVQLEVWSA